jgi:hypothetical protein
MMARDLETGLFVRVWPTGEIGMIVTMDAKRAGIMRVSEGPIWSYPREKLIPATRAQIRNAGLEGVGCVEPPE